jgi:GNAT superfamily N-acetyltransferase
MGVFETAGHRAEVARRDDIAALQAFLQANPAYTRLVEGREVAPDAAATEFDDEPPAAFAFDWRWLLLVRERASGELVGVIDLVKDLLAPGIWHVGLFFVAERPHGSGVAAELHAALQHWMHGQGARWLRLNVADRNLRGARFRRRQGYAFVCPREWTAPSGRVNTVWTLVKPLAGESLAGYFAAQTRDTQQPEPLGWA